VVSLSLSLSVFPTNILRTPLSCSICATCPAHLIRLDFITRTILGEEYRSLSSSLCSFYTPLSPRPFQVQIFFSAPYSQTLSGYVPPSVSATRFYTHTKTGKIIVLYILMFKFLHSKLKDKISAPNDRKHSLTTICS